MPPATSSEETLLPLRAITVEGFKSIDHEQTIEIRPLTILAGANSSGKSSMIQPLLLLKQTLEAPYDPGPLLLNGPNAKFTFVEQFLNRSRLGRKEERFTFGLSLGEKVNCNLCFRRTEHKPVELEAVSIKRAGGQEVYRPGVADLEESPVRDNITRYFSGFSSGKVTTTRSRCFLDVSVVLSTGDLQTKEMNYSPGFHKIERSITHTIHVPGNRGNPRRTYPLTAVGSRFPGTFDDYTASVIAARQDEANEISDDLAVLGLTWKVEAKAVDDTQVEIRVGRLPKPKGGSQDLVSLADVGFGVSQTLPVVVALRIAQPGQTVYIEQPEIHLHPRAQHAMARLLAGAAKRGVQVIIETHSSLLLLGVQSLIAREELDPALVKLHWFERDEDGLTKIASKDPDSAGRFGDWPVDFDDVSLEAQMAYLNAAEKKVSGHE
jgi:AAA ATPase domain